MSRSYQDITKACVSNYQNFASNLAASEVSRLKSINWNNVEKSTNVYNVGKATILKKINNVSSSDITEVLKANERVRSKLKLQDIDPGRAIVIEKYAEKMHRKYDSLRTIWRIKHHLIQRGYNAYFKRCNIDIRDRKENYGVIINPYFRIFKRLEHIDNEVNDIKESLNLNRNGYQEHQAELNLDNMAKVGKKNATNKVIGLIVKKETTQSRSRNDMNDYSGYYSRLNTRTQGKPPLPDITSLNSLPIENIDKSRWHKPPIAKYRRYKDFVDSNTNATKSFNYKIKPRLG